MSDALPAETQAAETADAETASPPGPTDRTVSRSAGLLSLVRRLIDYGRTLVETLQQRNTPDAPAAIAQRFGMISVALIIARIKQGLCLAETLETRVKRGARRLDAPPRRVVSRPIQDQPRQRPVAEGSADQGSSLPSARAIAKRIRHRQIGAVIADICRDLGIDSDHPLWAEVLDAITTNGGNRAKLVQDVIKCGFDAVEACLPVVLPPNAERLLASLFGGASPTGSPPIWATPPP